jgi:8-oxo-dGTP pyrophosphatase MutT (NUDIX family)
VLVRRLQGRYWLAVIQPQGKRDGHWALPKGAPDPGESVEEAALREVLEETGLVGIPAAKLGSTRYTYTWEGEKVFKIVTFFLMRYRSGKIGEIEEAMRVEVAAAAWIPLDEAPRLLAYRGERDVVRKAMAALDEQEL